jgi:DNA-binding XRE family transcriptional regulator
MRRGSSSSGPSPVAEGLPVDEEGRPDVAGPALRFASNLRRLRAAAGLSQEDLAFRAGMHRTQISLLEGGERMPRVETLIKLAAGVEATPSDLLDGIDWDPVTVVSGGLVITPRATEGADDG